MIGIVKTLVPSLSLSLGILLSSSVLADAQYSYKQVNLDYSPILANTNFLRSCVSTVFFLCFLEKIQFNSQTAPKNNNPQDIELNPQDIESLGITTQPVRKYLLDKQLKTSGEIENPSQQATSIGAPAQGTIMALLVNIGDPVEQGQPVALISVPENPQPQTETYLNISDAQAELLQAQAKLKQAETNYQLQQRLITTTLLQKRLEASSLPNQSKNIPPNLEVEQQLLNSQLQQTKKDLENAQIAVKLATNRLKLAQANNPYQANYPTFNNGEKFLPITAPISGKVAVMNVTYGQVINNQTKPLLTIANYNQVWVSATLSQQEKNIIQPGQPVTVKIAELPQENLSGNINYIAPNIGNLTERIPIRVKINNPPKNLQPGMRATIEVITPETSSDTLSVPLTAILEVNNKQWVYQKIGVNYYQPLEVNLGQTLGERVEIQGDLTAGDQVVVEGAKILYNLTQRQVQFKASLFSLWPLIGAGGVIIIVSFIRQRSKRFFVNL